MDPHARAHALVTAAKVAQRGAQLAPDDEPAVAAALTGVAAYATRTALLGALHAQAARLPGGPPPWEVHATAAALGAAAERRKAAGDATLATGIRRLVELDEEVERMERQPERQDRTEAARRLRFALVETEQVLKDLPRMRNAPARDAARQAGGRQR